MTDVLTVVAKIRAAKGKGDVLAAFLEEQAAAVRKAARYDRSGNTRSIESELCGRFRDRDAQPLSRAKRAFSFKPRGA